MSERLFSIDEVPEVPLLREPRGRRGAAAGSHRDARFLNDYPPEWECCTGCGGKGTRLSSRVDGGPEWAAWAERHPGHSFAGESIFHPVGKIACAPACLSDAPTETCPDCLGMGKLSARVRLEAGHRCVRCKHPWMPKGDAVKVNALLALEVDLLSVPRSLAVTLAGYPPRVERSGMHPCPTCGGSGHDYGAEADFAEAQGVHPIQMRDRKIPCPTCKGEGKVWEHWSPCTAECTHGGPVRITDATGVAQEQDSTGQYATTAEIVALGGLTVEAAWRILTVHHLDGDKANCRWWNLAPLCQACHLSIQSRVVMERVYPHEHSAWFRPFVAGYYAFAYLCKVCGVNLDRPRSHGRPPDEPYIPLDRLAGFPGADGYPHRCEPGLEVTREEAVEHMDLLLGLELAAA